MAYAMFAILMVSQYASASAWEIKGLIVNGGTCLPVPGASVHANFTGATNVTNAQGAYLLYLPKGAWNLTISASGYIPSSYQTPNGKAGIVERNYSILQPGETPGACSPSTSTNTVTTSVITVPTTTAMAVTTVTNSSGIGSGSAGGATDAIAVVIVIIIVALLAYYAMGRKGKSQAAHK